MEFKPRHDRRSEKRSPQFGAIEISFEDPTPVTVVGELIEISGRGFRASHNEKALAPGLEVHYKSATSSGRACVIWTHVQEGRCNSGFLILAHKEARQI
ncbi:MAG: hypothetical protein ABSF12_15790 [Bryobacteraceae bacterium]|jgi:hypothetical protein